MKPPDRKPPLTFTGGGFICLICGKRGEKHELCLPMKDGESRG